MKHNIIWVKNIYVGIPPDNNIVVPKLTPSSTPRSINIFKWREIQFFFSNIYVQTIIKGILALIINTIK